MSGLYRVTVSLATPDGLWSGSIGLSAGDVGLGGDPSAALGLTITRNPDGTATVSNIPNLSPPILTRNPDGTVAVELV